MLRDLAVLHCDPIHNSKLHHLPLALCPQKVPYELPSHDFIRRDDHPIADAVINGDGNALDLLMNGLEHGPGPLDPRRCTRVAGMVFHVWVNVFFELVDLPPYLHFLDETPHQGDVTACDVVRHFVFVQQLVGNNLRVQVNTISCWKLSYSDELN